MLKYKQDVALDNLQNFTCHKIQPTNRLSGSGSTIFLTLTISNEVHFA